MVNQPIPCLRERAISTTRAKRDLHPAAPSLPRLSSRSKAEGSAYWSTSQSHARGRAISTTRAKARPALGSPSPPKLVIPQQSRGDLHVGQPANPMPEGEQFKQRAQSATCARQPASLPTLVIPQQSGGICLLVNQPVPCQRESNINNARKARPAPGSPIPSHACHPAATRRDLLVSQPANPMPQGEQSQQGAQSRPAPGSPILSHACHPAAKRRDLLVDQRDNPIPEGHSPSTARAKRDFFRNGTALTLPKSHPKDEGFSRRGQPSRKPGSLKTHKRPMYRDRHQVFARFLRENRSKCSEGAGMHSSFQRFRSPTKPVKKPPRRAPSRDAATSE